MKLDQQIKNQEDLKREIDNLERQKWNKEKKYSNVMNQLEIVRNVYKDQQKRFDIIKLQIEEISKEIKNVMPINKSGKNIKMDLQYQYKQYIYDHLDLDQECVERCVQYNSLNQQLNKGRYKQSLNLIQKHFQQLDKLFKDFKL